MEWIGDQEAMICWKYIGDSKYYYIKGDTMSKQRLNQKEVQFIEKLYKEYHSDIMDYVSINMFNIKNVDYESIVQDIFLLLCKKWII